MAPVPQVDAILFLDVRALLHTMYQRLQAWSRYRLAAFNLRHSFPDASAQQLADNAEGCAICKDAMQARASGSAHSAPAPLAIRPAHGKAACPCVYPHCCALRTGSL